MKTSLFLVFGAFICVSVNGQGDTTTQPPTFQPPTPPPSTTSTSTPSTTTSTTPSTTTTTSTAAPSTSTAAPPTTSTPTPKFPANEGKWSVKSGNTVCIMMKGAIEASLPYVDADKKNQIGNVDVPKSAVASGNCGNDSQLITLSWNTTVSENVTRLNKLTFVFETNTTKTDTLGSEISSGKFALTNVTGVIYKDSVAFPNATDRETPIQLEIVNQATFQTPFNYSYACLAEEILRSSDGANIIKLRDIRFEAFKTSAAAEFSSPIQCPADDSSDVVPIAVGAALAGLVVIVLLAYLIGRRRSRARGYQSV